MAATGAVVGPERAADGSRPRVVVSVIATVDGRVSLSRSERLLEPDAGAAWGGLWPADAAALATRRAAWIEERHRPTVTLEGSGTFVADDAGPADLTATDQSAEELLADFVPHRTPRWFAVVDSRGRVPWTYTGDAETSLLVIASRSTPLPYLADLRRRSIPYLVCGADRVDLPEAIDRLGAVLGATCVVSEAGGHLNAALVAAGLVDELHVVTLPALVGGLGTPSVLDGPPRVPGDPLTRLTSLHVEVGDDGSIWTAYLLESAPTA